MGQNEDIGAYFQNEYKNNVLYWGKLNYIEMISRYES